MEAVVPRKLNDDLVAIEKEKTATTLSDQSSVIAREMNDYTSALSSPPPKKKSNKPVGNKQERNLVKPVNIKLSLASLASQLEN